MPISTRPPRNPPRSTSSRGRPHGPPGRHRRLRVRTRVRAQHVADWPGLCTGEPMASVPGMVATPHAAAARPTGISCVASTRTMAATSPPTSMPCQSTCPPRLRPYRPRLPRFRTGRKKPALAQGHLRRGRRWLSRFSRFRPRRPARCRPAGNQRRQPWISGAGCRPIRDRWRATSCIHCRHASRLPGEPDEGVDGDHFHPGSSRAVRRTFVGHL